MKLKNINLNYTLFIAILPVITILSGILFLSFSNDLAYKFYSEESFIEWIQALFYLATSLLFFSTLWKSKRIRFINLLIFLLGAFFILIFLEEISWGQKLINFSTPEPLTKINAQGEFNLHNLEIIQKNSLIHIAYILFCLTILTANLIIKKIKFYDLKEFLVPKSLFLYFAIPGVFYVLIEFFYNTLYFNYRGRHIPGGGDQEVFELILSMGCFFYALILRDRFKSKKIKNNEGLS